MKRKYMTAEEYLMAWPEGVSGGKGEGTSKAQLEKQNALQEKAFNLMQAQQQKVQDSVGKYLSGSEGFDPAQLAAMRAQFLNQNSMNYNQGAKNVMSALARRGSIQQGAPVGGDFTRGIASLEGAAASDRSSGLANIDITNLQQALNNRFNAASLINGQAAQLTSPISTFGSGANNALDQYVSASNSGFGAMFSKALGAGLGTGISKGITGGIGGMLGGGFQSGVSH